MLASLVEKANTRTRSHSSQEENLSIAILAHAPKTRVMPNTRTRPRAKTRSRAKTNPSARVDVIIVANGDVRNVIATAT